MPWLAPLGQDTAAGRSATQLQVQGAARPASRGQLRSRVWSVARAAPSLNPPRDEWMVAIKSPHMAASVARPGHQQALLHASPSPVEAFTEEAIHLVLRIGPSVPPGIQRSPEQGFFGGNAIRPCRPGVRQSCRHKSRAGGARWPQHLSRLRFPPSPGPRTGVARPLGAITPGFSDRDCKPVNSANPGRPEPAIEQLTLGRLQACSLAQAERATAGAAQHATNDVASLLESLIKCRPWPPQSSLAVPRSNASLQPGLHPGQNKQFHHTGWINSLVSPPAAPETGSVQKACGCSGCPPCRSGTVVNASQHTGELGPRCRAPVVLQFRGSARAGMSPIALKAVKTPSAKTATMLEILRHLQSPSSGPRLALPAGNAGGRKSC